MSPDPQHLLHMAEHHQAHITAALISIKEGADRFHAMGRDMDAWVAMMQDLLQQTKDLAAVVRQLQGHASGLGRRGNRDERGDA